MTLDHHESADESPLSTMASVTCLYEDAALFVLDKPSGLLVHRGWGVADVALVDFARERTCDRAAHPISRLDRGASGAVVFAKSPQAARKLSEQAQAGEGTKAYLALVRGELGSPLDIDHPISRQEDGPRVAARTLVMPIATAATLPRHVTLVKVVPLTGRLHQIRRHLKHVNFPLIGDVRYGHGDLNRAFRSRYGLNRLALHAHECSVRHPDTGEVISCTAPLPNDLRGPFERMGFELDHLHL